MPYTTIDKGSKYFNAVTYTGDGTTNQTKTITFGFQPDLAWFKARDAAQSHILVDSVRGGTKYIVSESTNAEATLGVAQLFTSTGMTISNDAGANSLNSNGSTKVSWGWLASNTTASNTSGTITSTVSANTTSGFSIVSYTGTGANATVGHGLGVAPKTIFFKRRNTTANWNVYHSAIGATNKLNLNLTDASSASGDFNNTSPTSSVFSVATAGEVNASGATYIAYCFAEVKGFSKAFSYTGNGNTDGTFVYCGFKPAFILIKRTNTTSTWHLSDNKRIGYNPLNYRLQPNNSNTEYTGVEIYHDMLSNGFKCRATDTDTNGSGSTYVGFAFAENPFVSSKGIPTTAR